MFEMHGRVGFELHGQRHGYMNEIHDGVGMESHSQIVGYILMHVTARNFGLLVYGRGRGSESLTVSRFCNMT